MIHFTKLHGEGNDFILVDGSKLGPDVDFPELARATCHRHFGIGADGLMIAMPSEQADIKMVYYNSDGSEAKMCGNGIRCFTRFVYDNSIVILRKMKIETGAGILDTVINFEDNDILSVTVNMGKPSIEYLSKNIDLDEMGTFEIHHALMGVPHTVLFREDVFDFDISALGSRIEAAPIFPHHTNVNFVQVVSRCALLVDTWERGAGHTLACGTGVCASVAIAHELGYVDRVVDVKVLGGSLKIEISEKGELYMTGGAKPICEGLFMWG